MKTWIAASLITALSWALLPAAGLASMSIEQEVYLFRMDVTRDVMAGTFVIGEFENEVPLSPPAAATIAIKNRSQLALRTAEESNATGTSSPLIPPILFDLASAELPEKPKTEILQALEKKVSRSTPLQVTGFTCDLGAQMVNDKLARQRAEAVAELLKSHGYVVPVVTGKGKQDYLSKSPQMRHLNRRVEIIALPPGKTRSHE
jgi:outer membrane protein OmpA-like peptidoglycan-associated protein